MSKRRKNRKQLPQESVGIIDVYKVVDEDALEDELKAIDYEQPVFAVPGLDELLSNTEKEAAQLMTIYKL